MTTNDARPGVGRSSGCRSSMGCRKTLPRRNPVELDIVQMAMAASACLCCLRFSERCWAAGHPFTAIPTGDIHDVSRLRDYGFHERAGSIRAVSG